MGRRTRTARPPKDVSALVRRLLLRDGVASTARRFNLGREQVLAVAVGLEVSPGVLALVVNSPARDLDRVAA